MAYLSHGTGSPQGATARAPLTILLVEDDEGVRAALKKQLEILGHTVLDAETGTGAIVLASGWPDQIDLLIADLVLPWLSGPDAAATIRRERPGMKVIFMSGHDVDGESVKRIRSRGDDYLQKPFSISELMAIVLPQENAT